MVNAGKQFTEHTSNTLSITLRPVNDVDERGDQTACKPGSVPPANGRDDHSSGPSLAGRFSRPTRTSRAYDSPTRARRAQRPYSVLLLAGLAVPSLSPGPRWALTPPFHPYPPSPPATEGEPCVALAEKGGLLSVALSLGSPPAGVTRRHVEVEPGLSSTALRRPRSPGRLVRAEREGSGPLGQAVQSGDEPFMKRRKKRTRARSSPSWSAMKTSYQTASVRGLSARAWILVRPT
jgi:hypothetical protein